MLTIDSISRASFTVAERHGSGNGASLCAMPSTAERRAEGMKNPLRQKSQRGKPFRRAGDRTRTGDVQLGKLAFYH
jgi:hypothetical protein